MYDIRHAYLFYQIDPIMISDRARAQAEDDRCWI